MQQRYLEYWQVLFLLLFFTHTACLSRLWDVKPYPSSIVFLCSDPFVLVLLSSISGMIRSIVQVKPPICLWFWWDFSYTIWFQVAFWFSGDSLFYFYFISSAIVWWCPLPIFPSNFLFLRTFWICLYLVVLFPPSCFISSFLLLAWRISNTKIHPHVPIVYSNCLYEGFRILFHFWQIVWCCPCTLGD